MNVRELCQGCEECNRMSPLFKILTDEERAIMNGERYSVRFHPGEVILKQGTQAVNYVSVVEGFAKTYVEGFNDRRLILDFLKPWYLIGAPGIHDGEKHPFSVVAVEETLVCFIDSDRFRRVLARNSQFSLEYIRMCSQNFTRSLQRMVSLSQKQMHGRIADALIYLSEEIYDSSVIGPEISRQDMAEYTGMSKDSGIRILKEFERDGVILLEDRTIVILDRERLHRISEKG